MLRFIEINEDKTPKGKYKNGESVIYDISNVTNAALLIPDGIVVIDFDGDNINRFGKVYDDNIAKYIINQYKPYWVISRPNHCHLYFKMPNGIKIYKKADVVTLGGLIVDYLAPDTLAIVKQNGIMRRAESLLTEERLSNLPELPPFLYPLYGYFCDNLPHFGGMAEHDGRDDAIYKYINEINIVNSKFRLGYKMETLKEAVAFIDSVLFKDPLGENIINEKVERCFNEFIENSKKEAQNKDEKEDLTPLEVKKLSEIEEEEIKWIWEPYIPLGCLVALVGDPGLGKSTIAMKIASILSKGEIFPFSTSQMPPSTVIFQNGEDNTSTTIIPRLKEAGANLDNIIMIDEDEKAFSLDRVTSLDELITKTNCKLMIIDPIQAYMPEKTNLNSRGDVRKALNPIKNIAQKHQCTIMYIMHNNKDIKNTAMNKAAGSGDFIAITRSVLSISEDDSEKRYINHIKSSLAAEGKSIEYRINDKDCVEFVRQVTSVIKKEKPIKRAMKFIRAYMSDEEEVKAKDIKEAAARENISIDTLTRAKEKMGIISKQKHESDANVWYWVISNPEKYKSSESVEDDLEWPRKYTDEPVPFDIYDKLFSDEIPENESIENKEEENE